MTAVATLAGLVTAVAIAVIALAVRPSRARKLPAGARPPAPARPALRPVVVAIATTLGVASVVVVGPAPVVAAGVAGVAVGVGRRRRQAAARRRSLEAAMPDAIELLVLCVHAGRSPAQAVVELARRAPAPLADGFAAVERQLHRGRRLADALTELSRVVGPGARELASSIAIADREGLPLAPVLDRLAAEARAERRRLGEAAARRLPVQLSFPHVGCTLPSFVLLAIAPAVLGAISTLRGTVP
jgi:Flp pilus assembly protein TadB